MAECGTLKQMNVIKLLIYIYNISTGPKSTDPNAAEDAAWQALKTDQIRRRW